MCRFSFGIEKIKIYRQTAGNGGIYEKGERKSIPYEVFIKEGVLIKQGYHPRLPYLDAVNEK